LTDNVSTCGFDGSATSETSIHPLQKALFRKISVDSQTGDILCEVEFGIRKITEAQASNCISRNNRNSLAPQTRLYEIRFHFDGNRLAVSPESVADMRIVQDQRDIPNLK